MPGQFVLKACPMFVISVKYFLQIASLPLSPVTNLYSCDVHIGGGGSLWKKCHARVSGAQQRLCTACSHAVQGRAGASLRAVSLWEEGILGLSHWDYV